MASHQIIQIEIPVYLETTAAANGPLGIFDVAKGEPRDIWNFLSALAMKARAGVEDAGIVIRTVGVNAPSATFSFTCTQASATIGDRIRFLLPSGEEVFLLQTGATADPSQGQYQPGASDTTFATAIALAVNANPRLTPYFTATSSTGTVTLTSRSDTLTNNTITVFKLVTTSGVFSLTSGTTFSGARSVMDSTSSSTVLLTGTPTANDTLVLGPSTLTWVASAANENQVTINGTNGSATNLAAAINAHSILSLYWSATVNTATVTILPRFASVVHKASTLTKTGTWTPTISAALFPSTVTLEGAGATYSYNIR